MNICVCDNPFLVLKVTLMNRSLYWDKHLNYIHLEARKQEQAFQMVSEWSCLLAFLPSCSPLTVNRADSCGQWDLVEMTVSFRLALLDDSLGKATCFDMGMLKSALWGSSWQGTLINSQCQLARRARAPPSWKWTLQPQLPQKLMSNKLEMSCLLNPSQNSWHIK